MGPCKPWSGVLRMSRQAQSGSINEVLCTSIINGGKWLPTYLECLSRWRSRRVAARPHGQTRITRSLSHLCIVATVQAMLASRIDRLPTAEKQLLQTLAVIGTEFSQKLAARHAIGFSEKVNEAGGTGSSLGRREKCPRNRSEKAFRAITKLRARDCTAVFHANRNVELPELGPSNGAPAPSAAIKC